MWRVGGRQEGYTALMKSEGSVAVRLYRFYNWEAEKSGEPFALCDHCLPKQTIPDYCFLTCIADGARLPCALAGKLTPSAREAFQAPGGNGKTTQLTKGHSAKPNRPRSLQPYALQP